MNLIEYADVNEDESKYSSCEGYRPIAAARKRSP